MIIFLAVIKQKKDIYDYYVKNIPYEFQSILLKSNYNVVGCLAGSREERDFIVKMLQDKIEIKVRYTPDSDLELSNDYYDRMLCLPSWPGVDYRKITKLLRGFMEKWLELQQLEEQVILEVLC